MLMFITLIMDIVAGCITYQLTHDYGWTFLVMCVTTVICLAVGSGGGALESLSDIDFD